MYNVPEILIGAQAKASDDAKGLSWHSKISKQSLLFFLSK